LHKVFEVCGTPESLDGYTGPPLPKRAPRIEEELMSRWVTLREPARQAQVVVWCMR
jgi:hypothetical protein